MGISKSKELMDDFQEIDDTAASNVVLKKINQSRALCFKVPAVEARERLARQLSNVDQIKEYFLNINSVLNNVSILDVEVSMKIKFTLVDNLKSDTSKNVRQIMSPLLDKIDQLPNHGIYHSCLTVGPWLIDYTDCGLCIPRKIISKSAFLSIDIAEVRGIPNITTTIDKLAKSIQKWNTSVNYKRKSRRKSSKLFLEGQSVEELEEEVEKEVYNTGNCQDFVDYLLDSLKVKPVFSHNVKEFLNQLKVKGKSDLTLKLNEKFCERFLLVNNSNVDLKGFLSDLNMGKSVTTSSHIIPKGNRPKRSSCDAGTADKKAASYPTLLRLQGRKSEGSVTMPHSISCPENMMPVNNNEVDTSCIVRLDSNYCITFNNHVQIDLFTHICMFQDPNFKDNYPDIFELLKAFDRAFWVKHQSTLSLKQNTEEDKLALQDSAPLLWSTWNNETNCHQNFGCPFGDPFLTTKSFMSL
ncbi:hypothetical protein ABK040_004379 [Willaertia magna]